MARRVRKSIINLPQLRRICKLWQTRLKLDDWSISIEFVAKIGNEEEGDEPAVGCAGWDSDRREAWISVVRGADNWETETTVIHELLHVVNSGHTVCASGHDVNEERAINAVAECLALGYSR